MPIEQCTEAALGCLMGDAVPSSLSTVLPIAAVT
jgi:hypothetical protein